MMKGVKRSGEELLLSEKPYKCPKVEHEQNDNMIKKSSFENYLIKHNIFDMINISYLKIDNFFKDLTSNWSVELSDEELDFLISVELNKILQHISFRQYFRLNLEVYCNFVTLVVSKINSVNLVAQFLKNELVFHKTFISEKEFRKNFMKTIFPGLVNILCKLKDKGLYQEVCEIFKKVILDKNVAEFQKYLEYSLELTENKTDDKFEIPKTVLKTVGGSYNSHSEAYSAHKIMFQSLVDSIKDFRVIYTFSIAMIEILGFNLGRDFSLKKKISKFSSSDVKLSKSLKLLLEMLKILKNCKVDLNCSVMITFSQFIENIVNSVLNLTISPNKDTYEILEYSIDIHPLLVEKHLNKLIAYSMFADNSDCEENYSRLLLKIFETYAKLHRIQNLISKMLPILKSIEDNNNFEEYYTFRGCDDVQGIMKRNLNANKVLPDEVLQYFSQCAMQMASWQYMNLFKTFIFHLDKTVEGFMVTNGDDHNSFIEVLCKFTSWLLRINRMSGNTTTTKIMENFNSSMGEVKDILKKLGGALLGREHDQSLVRVFLNLSHDWAERFIMFHHYNSGYLQDEEIFFDVNHTNYLFSFLSHEQWILLSQRIMNFGESNCKYLMLILIIQKLRAMHIFGNKMDENTQREAIDQITSNVEGACEYIVSEKFISEYLLHKLDSDVIMNICDQILIRVDDTPIILKEISDSQILSDALGFVLLKKISKVSKAKSSSLLKKLLSVVDKEICIFNLEEDESYFTVLKEIYEQNLWTVDELSMNQEYEERIQLYFKYLMKLPIPYLSSNIKSLILVGLFSLHKQFWGIECEFKLTLETFIKNLIREVKIDLVKIFEPKSLMRNLTTNFSEKEEFIAALCENCFKDENLFKGLIPAVDYLLENVNNTEHLQYSLLFLKYLKKVKKSKCSIEFKEFCSEIRNNILNVNFEVITSKHADELMIPSYAYCLKHWIVLEEEEKLKKLVDELDKYLNLILDMKKDILPKGSASLFCTVLPNKHIFKVSSGLPLKIWTYCKMKKVEPSEVQDFSQLLCLIFEHVENDKFELVSSELFEMAVESINEKNYSQLFKHLQTGTFLLTSSLNPIKIEIWQKVLEKLLLQLQSLKEDIIYDEKIFEEIIKFEVAIINRKTLVLTPCMISMFLMSPYTFLRKGSDFYQDFNIGTNYLESLLKHRSSMIMDRLPTYLKVFRGFLFALCRRCGEAEKNNDLSELENLAECAHQLEKLVRLLVIHKKDMARIACHLIGDILLQYETFTLYPKVKVHLNNCMYSLISLCDNHAVSYLLRVLSSASTELFKKVFDDFKRFHRFTGKV